LDIIATRIASVDGRFFTTTTI